jgi:hypothetical protein
MKIQPRGVVICGCVNPHRALDKGLTFPPPPPRNPMVSVRLGDGPASPRAWAAAPRRGSCAGLWARGRRAGQLANRVPFFPIRFRCSSSRPASVAHTCLCHRRRRPDWLLAPPGPRQRLRLWPHHRESPCFVPRAVRLVRLRSFCECSLIARAGSTTKLLDACQAPFMPVRSRSANLANAVFCFPLFACCVFSLLRSCRLAARTVRRPPASGYSPGH